MKCWSLAAAILVTGALVTNCDGGITVSLGVRESTGSGPIGSNVSSTLGIEWIRLDDQSFAFDGNWHTLTWNLDGTNVTAFAGSSANGTLEGAWGALENLRFLNSDSVAGPISIHIDNMVVTTPTGATTLTDFEGYSVGQAVMFRPPNFSGSTSANLAPGSTSGVTDTVAQSGTRSYKVDFQFVDNAPTRWVRLTTSNTPTLGNPAIPFGPGTSLSVSFMAVPEPSSVGLLMLGAAGLLRRRKR